MSNGSIDRMFMRGKGVDFMNRPVQDWARRPGNEDENRSIRKMPPPTSTTNISWRAVGRRLGLGHHTAVKQGEGEGEPHGQKKDGLAASRVELVGCCLQPPKKRGLLRAYLLHTYSVLLIVFLF